MKIRDMKKLLLLLLLAPLVSFGQMKALLMQQVIEPPYYHSTGGFWMSTQAVTNGVYVYPSGLQNDDILILVLVNKEAITYTTPTGWTQLGVINNATMSYGIYWRRVDGNEPSNSVTMGTSAKGTIVYNYREVNTSSSPYNTSLLAPLTAVNRGSSVSGNTNDLAVELWIVNTELTATGNSASGWVEDYNNGSSGTSGFTFVNASYLFGTSPSTTPTYPNINSFIANCEFVLPN